MCFILFKFKKKIKIFQVQKLSNKRRSWIFCFKKEFPFLLFYFVITKADFLDFFSLYLQTYLPLIIIINKVLIS